MIGPLLRRPGASHSGATPVEICPHCAVPLVAPRRARPWCARCEWDLDAYDSGRRDPDFGWRWLDRRAFRLAYRVGVRQCADLAGRSVTRPGVGPVQVVTVLASALLMVALSALFGVACWLVWFRFPNPTIVPGAILLALAVALRPRFGRLDGAAERLDRASAPALFGLVDRVAAAVGAPSPETIAADARFNAYATAVGVRRRRVLCLGLPLWGALTPGQRVALLGHELGHFVNGDVRRGLLTQPAFTTLMTAADLMRPVHEDSSGLSWLAVRAAQAVQWLLSTTLRALHLMLVAVALRDARQAEYLADELSARVAGTEAAVSLIDSLLDMEVFAMLVRQSARAGGGAAQWRAAVQQAATGAADRLPLLRQLSVREGTSLFASHPPYGLRVRMIRGRPANAAALVLSEAESDQIDRELEQHYRRAGREIA